MAVFDVLTESCLDSFGSHLTYEGYNINSSEDMEIEMQSIYSITKCVF